ncbi:thyrostimulin alpha-2 subunit-like isoform X2 [Drosophila sechellia]|uniref:thyrostimulin alpha-2 subunit-like isoform X2 n=1 Tax=Drosophila sechellia TaxID=7238 RepID=UPI0013DDB1E1|nr:thyrostimulin alpha-2 subunit-like isoform X2 [Drosophila sechellia]
MPKPWPISTVAEMRSSQLLVLVCCIPWLLLCDSNSMGKDAWLRPGCHIVGNTRKITIPDCVEFNITTNACRGFLVSVGQCCNMMKSEEIQRRVLCIEGIQNVTFNSALSCSCYHCKKD